MNIMYGVLLSLTMIFVGACSDTGDKSHANHEAQAPASTYTCPMHPSVISDKPGACPVCGMSLVKVSEQTELSADEEESLGHVSLSPTQRVLANVATVAAERATVIKTVPLIGFVDVAEPMEATVAARFRGRIERLHVNETGVRVRAGEPLFELYSPDLVTAVREFVLSLESSEARPAQEQNLLDGIRSRLQMHYGMTPVQLSEIESNRAVRSSVTFHSPMTGTVLSKNVREGQYVNEGEVLYRVADLSKVWIMIDVYEQDVRHFSVGQTVVISAEAYPGERFSGRITFIDPVMNPATRTARIRTEFSNKHGRLMPNMFVSAEVELSEKDVIRIPRSALLETGRRSIVWVESATNAFEPREVTVGFRGDASVEITSGLSAGELVASSGGFLIDSESSLQQGATGYGHQHDGNEKDAPSPDNGVVQITVEGSYTPDIIRVRKGTPLRLRFFRNESSQCTKEIVFPELGIRRTLADFDTTEIRITPTEAGTIHFSCGMDMVHGQLIVE